MNFCFGQIWIQILALSFTSGIVTLDTSSLLSDLEYSYLSDQIIVKIGDHAWSAWHKTEAS